MNNKRTKPNKLSLVVASFAALVLAGCDYNNGTPAPEAAPSDTAAIDSDSDTGSDTGTTTTDTSGGAAHTIVLTYPMTDAVENLGGGVYRQIAKAIVTDNDGNPVPDGTVVNLNLIDSVVAQGVINSIDGAVLTDSTPTLGDGTTPTDFTTAYVIRNEAHRFLEAGDRVLLAANPRGASNADPVDKDRVISSSTGAIMANTLTVSEDYVGSYPNGVYGGGVTDYVAGVSALGGLVLGVDAAGELTNSGRSVTKNGVATFHITYPATSETIHTGCVSDPTVDTRSLPAGSARVYVVASAGGNATTIDSRFCFKSMLPWALNPSVDTLYAYAGDAPFDVDVVIAIRDANRVILPFASVDVTAFTTGSGDLVISTDDDSYMTGPDGYFVTQITVDPSLAGQNDAATVLYTTEDEDQIEIKVKIQ